MLILKLRAFFQTYRFPLLVGLALRLATSLWLGLIWFSIEPRIQMTEKLLKETYNQLAPHANPLARIFLDVWLRWDAVHYLNLAQFGYENAGLPDMNFWPLYPYLVGFIRLFTFGDVMVAGLLVSTVSTFVALVLFWKLVLTMFGDERLANWTVIAWTVFHTSFFLVAPFTDSLYACLALAALLFLKKEWWLAAGVTAFFAGLARAQGAVLAVPFLIAIGYKVFRSRKAPAVASVFSLAAAPLGFGLYLLYRATRGTPDIITSFRLYSDITFTDPFTGLWMGFVQLLSAPDYLLITEFLVSVLFLSVLVWMFTRPQFRLELGFLAYGLFTALYTLTKHTLLASPLQSANRYALNVLPVFVGFAWLLVKMKPRWRGFAVTLSVTLGMISLAMYALWMFIG